MVVGNDLALGDIAFQLDVALEAELGVRGDSIQTRVTVSTSLMLGHNAGAHEPERCRHMSKCTTRSLWPCECSVAQEPEGSGPMIVARSGLRTVRSESFDIVDVTRGAAAWIDGFQRAMRPHVSGMAYQNYFDAGLRLWRSAYCAQNYARLSDVKGRYDPDRVFCFALRTTAD